MAVTTSSDQAPVNALDGTAAAIASARRATLAERYAPASLAVEWTKLSELEPIVPQWRELAANALEPNVFYEPAFALEAARVFGRDAGAILVWSGSGRRKLVGFFPARFKGRRYGFKLRLLVGWTHPYAPLGTPLIDREAGESVIAAWFAHIADSADLPGLLLLPFLPLDGPFAAALGAILRRGQMPSAEFNRHSRAQLEPRLDRSRYLKEVLSARRYGKLRRLSRRLAEVGTTQFVTWTEPVAVASGVQDFCTLEARGWKGRGGTAIACHGDHRRFVEAAVGSLAAEGKVRIHCLNLGERPIAMAITLRSADTAWVWKIAYDEDFARFSPGVMLAAAMTEDLVGDVALARTDSCATANHPMIEPMWRERLLLCDRMIAARPGAPFAAARRLESLRWAAINVAKDIRAGFPQQ